VRLNQTYLKDFVALLFPELCQACNSSLVGNEDLICTNCLYDLPYTNFISDDNVITRQLEGRVKASLIYVMLYFSKGGTVQNLMHSLKYKNTPGIGNKLGALAGQQLAQMDLSKGFDMIIPVPLHPAKLRQRGYNQSTHFAQGLASVIHKPVVEHNLIRSRYTETQTNKSKYVRFDNMKDVFAVKQPSQLEGKHILLVDDIVTTGATLEACANQLLKISGVTLSVAAIAYVE
jgi:ComF family protein